MQDLGERDHIRGQHAGDPGRGHLIEQLAGQRENLVAYGQDTAGVDAQLADLGYVDPAARSKAEAAEARKADAARRKAEQAKAEQAKAAEPPAAKDDPKSAPPAGRRAPARQTASKRG